MSVDRRSSMGRDLWWGATVSVVLHVLIAAVVVLAFTSEDEPEPPDEPESMEVVLDDDTPEDFVEEEVAEPSDEMPLPVEEPDRPEEDDQEPQHEEEEQPEEDDREEPEEEPDPVDDQDFERYAVEQQTDDVEPDHADYIADEAHQTDEETVAETTTLEDVEPIDDTEAPEQEADTEREYAMEAPDEPIDEPDIVDPTEIADADDDEGDDDEHDGDDRDDEDDAAAEQEAVQDDAVDEPEPAEEPQQYRDPSEMFVDDGDEPDSEVDDDIDHHTLFGRDAEQAQEVLDTEQGEQGDGADGEASGRRLLANWRENEEALRASLENFLPHVQPGNHTSVNAHEADHASYIARLHRTIHANWGDGFLPRVQRNFSNAHPLNDMSLEVVVEIVIDADNGDVVETGRIETSGNEMFDAAALNVARRLGDQPEPPDSMVSPDGHAYIHWTFWRDVRQCGTFGVRLYRLQDESERRSVD